MRWLLIGLLVSVGVLVLAAAGVARHIWLHRKGLAPEKSSKIDVEPEG